MRDTHTTAEIFEIEQNKNTQYIPLEGMPAEETGNPFPVHVFPEPFQSFIKAIDETLNLPPEHTGTALLVAVSTAVGNTARMQVKQGWVQPPVLFAGLVGPPGLSKSHAITNCMRPFEYEDGQEIKRYREDLKAFKNNLIDFKKQPKKGDSPKSHPVEPTPLQTTVLNSATPEALVKHVVGNRRGCAVVSDELATYFESITQYSKGQNLSFMLSLWGASPITQLRVGESGDGMPRHASAPFVNIIGGIQPKVLRDVFSSRLVNNGLLPRFLWAYPDRAEKQPINDLNFEQVHADSLDRWLREYRENHPLRIDQLSDTVRPTHYIFDSAAFAFYKKVQTINTKLVNEYGDCTEAEVLSKFDDHLARLSLLLQIMQNPNSKSDTVGVEAVEAAATLCEYYANTALRVVRVISRRGTALPELQLNFFEALPGMFTTAQAIGIGAVLNIHERKVKEWLGKYPNLFKHLDHGRYQKL
jgi:hypothetical protein